jgi:branched chain amino acid efflux pump
MSWTTLLALGGVSYALKAVGPLLAGGRQLGPQTRRILELVAVPLLAALIVVQALANRHRLLIDARAAALTLAAVLAWRRAPFLVVVLASAKTAPLLRAVARRAARSRVAVVRLTERRLPRLPRDPGHRHEPRFVGGGRSEHREHGRPHIRHLRARRRPGST